MTRLVELRRRLARLRRRRQRIRTGTAIAGFAAAVLLILAAAFLLDMFFEMGRWERAVLLVLCVAAAVWALRRYFLPWVGYYETDLQMALMVERQHQIDSDLIAALEFESPEATRWGSAELELAVIDAAASSTRRLNVMQGISRKQLGRRSALLAGMLVVWVGIGGLFPGYFVAFLKRLGLAATHYPTRTLIETITINGRKIDPLHPGKTPARVFFGQPARFQVHCGGQVPKEPGRVVLSASQSGARTTLDLQPDADNPGVFRGEWPQPTEDVQYQVFVGDAWTDAGQLEVTDLPVIEVQPEVVPPAYAGKASGHIRLAAGLMQFSVVEGSQVVFRMASDKWLKRAYLTVGDNEYDFRREKISSGDDGRDAWIFESLDSPLGNVTELTRYAIQVVDRDDQQLERPKEGLIRIQADLPPRIAAAIVTHFVLPAGKPTVYFRAKDDYGIKTISVLREITHPDSDPIEDELTIYDLPAGAKPQLDLESSVVLDFGAMKLASGEPVKLTKGDTVKITLRAVDFRGRNEGKMASAEPLVFQVTDEQGVIASMMEADRHSVQQLKTMMQRQLGIGDSP